MEFTLKCSFTHSLSNISWKREITCKLVNKYYEENESKVFGETEDDILERMFKKNFSDKVKFEQRLE